MQTHVRGGSHIFWLRFQRPQHLKIKMDSDDLEDDLSDGKDKTVVYSVFGAVYAMMRLAEEEEDDDEEEEVSDLLWGVVGKGRSQTSGGTSRVLTKYWPANISAGLHHCITRIRLRGGLGRHVKWWNGFFRRLVDAIHLCRSMILQRGDLAFHRLYVLLPEW